MDHVEAFRTRAAESYILDELTDEKRAEFEEHFFGCNECAVDLASLDLFVKTGKQLFRKEQTVIQFPVRQSSFAWIKKSYATAASLIFAMLLIYQNAVVIPNLKKSAVPQPLDSISLTAARDLDANVFSIMAGKPLIMAFDLPPEITFKVYRGQVLNSSGMPVFSFNVPVSLAQKTIPLFVPANTLTSGKYTLIIWGGNQDSKGNMSEVGKYTFELR